MNDEDMYENDTVGYQSSQLSNAQTSRPNIALPGKYASITIRVRRNNLFILANHSKTGLKLILGVIALNNGRATSL